MTSTPIIPVHSMRSSTQLSIDFDQIDSFFNEKLVYYSDTTVDVTNVVPLVFTANNLNVQKSFILPIPVVPNI